jgi:hypothetical protein
MIVIAIVNFYNYFPEQPWGRFYPFEGFIFSIAIIVAGYYYPFIQERQLNLKKNNQLTRITALIMSGILSIFIVIYYWEPVTSILYFLLFLAFGIVGTLKAINEEVKIETVIASLVFAEVQVLLLIIKLQPIRVIDSIIIFICTITFLILPLASIIFNKKLHNPAIFYAVWSILGTINCIITGFVNDLDYWLFFTIIVLLITVEFITNLLGNIQSVPNWRLMSLIGMVVVFAVTITFGISRFLLAFEFVPYIIFSYILLATAPTFFDIKPKEGIINE